jgi:hypothetical protein
MRAFVLRPAPRVASKARVMQRSMYVVVQPQITKLDQISMKSIETGIVCHFIKLSR